jgi:hypothetical protein
MDTGIWWRNFTTGSLQSRFRSTLAASVSIGSGAAAADFGRITDITITVKETATTHGREPFSGYSRLMRDGFSRTLWTAMREIPLF